MDISMIEQLVNSWRINQQINRLLLDAIDEDWLPLRAASEGMTVGQQWAHMTNVRGAWARMKLKKLAADLEKLPQNEVYNKTYLLEHMERSASIFETIFTQYQDGIYAKGHHVSITTFYSYILSHDAHHRGQIILHLKLCGKILPKEVLDGIWKW